MVEMARFIKPILGIVPAGPDRQRPAPAPPARRPRSPLRPAPRAPAGRVRPADDDVGQGLPRPVVRDGPAQGDDVRVAGSSARTRASARRARRTSCCTTTWARSTARSAPGASPRAGPAACRTRSPARPRPRAPRSAPRRPSPGSTSRDDRATGVVLESGEEIEAHGRPLVRGRQGDVPRPARARHARPRVRAGGPAVQVPRQLGQGQPRRRPAAGLHAACPGVGRAPARRDLVQPLDARHGAGLRRREVRALEPPPVHRHDHPDPRRPPDGAAGQARHQLLRPVRAVQAGARAGHVGRQPRGVRRRGDQPDRRVRAEHPGHHHRPPGPDAPRHRADDRPDRGEHLPGRAVPRAAVLQPAGAGLRALPDADPATCGCRARRPIPAAA